MMVGLVHHADEYVLDLAVLLRWNQTRTILDDTSGIYN